MEKSATLASLGQAHQMRPNEFAQSVEKLLAQEPAGRLPKAADKVVPERNEGERGEHGAEEEGADGFLPEFQSCHFGLEPLEPNLAQR